MTRARQTNTAKTHSPSQAARSAVLSANSGCLLGTKWQKSWMYKNVSRIVKIVRSALRTFVVCLRL